MRLIGRILRHGIQRFRKSTSKDVLIITLEALRESADSLPPLRSALSTLLFLTDLSTKMSLNKDDLGRLYTRVDEVAASMEHALPDIESLAPSQIAAIASFDEELRRICSDMSRVQSQSRFACFVRAQKNTGDLVDFERRLNAAELTFLAPPQHCLDNRPNSLRAAWRDTAPDFAASIHIDASAGDPDDRHKDSS
ncbi:hypothetical protein K488DRAFT_86486 [Vararia minispora EC-137]|uniref:Uncharacterized protein n=1 Tax=Vararia minispora EC-137 TaxID=1314806 RepID=A0ACB8QJI1_9AGAM|nr:hypothetical protein K488DRAFT_86486 [Vararia minispora EC-137]